MSNSLVSIKTVEELKKVLFLQKTITQRAKAEMLAIASDEMLDDSTTEVTEEQAAKFMAEEEKLLEKYAKYPTLTEFALQPKLQDGAKWGATFGVSILVGELVFEQVRHMQPHFGTVLRQMYILLLSELESPVHEYLVEPLEEALKFQVTTEDGGEVTAETGHQYVRTLVQSLVEDFLIVSNEYGLVDSRDEGFFITPIGKRVLLHLLDASKFIDEMTKAHTKFQSMKPKLSMI